MPRSVVVDASILVSAFLFPESTPGRVIALARRGAYALHLSPILIEEVRRRDLLALGRHEASGS